MWQLLTPFRKRVETRHTLAHRPRRYRPHCKPLEDRCLLSVSLTRSGPPVPLVGSPVSWTATASGHGTTPVYQFSVEPPGGASQMVRDFSPSNSFTWDPMQEGTYNIQVTVKDSFSASTGESATASYTAKSRVVGTSAVISPTSNPLVALYSAPPPPAVRCTSSSPAGPQPVLDQYRSAAHCAGGEHQLPRGWHAAQHDVPHEARPERWHGLRPSGVHDREPAVELGIPQLHCTAAACPRYRPDSGHGFHTGIAGAVCGIVIAWRRT